MLLSMACRVLFLSATLALVQTFRIDQRKIAARDSSAQLRKEELQDPFAKWWDSLADTCTTCLKIEHQHLYLPCKADCASTTKYKSDAYVDCKNACQKNAREYSMKLFKHGLISSHCDGACSDELKKLSAATLAENVLTLQERVEELESPKEEVENPRISEREIVHHQENFPRENKKMVAVPNLNGIRLGPRPTSELVPELVPADGTYFEVVSIEPSQKSHEYKWTLQSVSSVDGLDTATNANPEIPFARVTDGYSHGAYKTLVVKNSKDQPIFNIMTSNHKYNPFSVRHSFRIVDPFTENILYTVTKDLVGRGRMWSQDVWRIYTGRKRHKKQKYYCVGSVQDYGHVFYKNEKEYKNNSATPVAQASKLPSKGGDAGDVFKLRVAQGADTALLLAATAIIDMVDDEDKKGMKNIVK